MKIKIMADIQAMNGDFSELNSRELKLMSNRIINNPVELEIDKLLELMVKSYPFTDSCYSMDGGQIAFIPQCWRSQQLFILSINNDSVEGFIEDCKKNGIYPAFAFNSVVRGIESIFVTFITSMEITDLRMKLVIIGCLRKLFNAGERISTFKQAIDQEFSQFNSVYCSITEILYVDTTAFVDIPFLLDVTCFRIYKTSSGGNGSKDVKSFLTAINLLYGDHGCKMEVIGPHTLWSSKFTKLCEPFIYINKGQHENVSVFFNLDLDIFIKIVSDRNANIDKINSVKYRRRPLKWDECNDINLLIANENGCKLLTELVGEVNSLTPYELSGIASNICGIKGAEEFIDSYMIQKVTDKDKADMFRYFIRRCRKIGYSGSPIPCRHFCDNFSECNSKRDFELNNITDLFPQSDNTIHELKGRQLSFADAGEIREQLQCDFEADLYSNETGLYIYKCFVGIGKTRLYLQHINKLLTEDKTILIALPDHELKDEVVERLFEDINSNKLLNKLYYNYNDSEIKVDTNNIIVVPAIPNVSDEFTAEIKCLYSIGDFEGAREVIKNKVDEIKSKEQSCVTEEEIQLKNYYNITCSLYKRSYTAGKVIFTTHERLFFLQGIKADITIIDEDITKSLLKIQRVKTEELLKIYQMMDDNESVNIDVKKRIIGVIDSDIDSIQTFDNNIKGEKVVQKIITQNKNKFSSRIAEFLFNSSAFIKRKVSPTSNDTEISFITMRNIDIQGKIFILSATIDEEIATRLFGNYKLRKYLIPYLKANIELNSDYSFSHSSVQGLEDQLFLYTLTAMKVSDNQGKTLIAEGDKDQQPLIITFKDNEQYFRDMGFMNIMHFWKLTGIDNYAGKNVYIVGTPHNSPVACSLYTYILFPEAELSKVPNIKKNILVKRNGYSFRFTTTEEDGWFRHVQFWLIESEMIQAIGRARPIDNECTIRIYSNLPLPDINMKLKV